jgi:hypothetical protein
MNLEYITEKRGGYDEWSDTYKAIIGIKIGDSEIEKRFFYDGKFIDENGDILEVNIPGRKHDDITVQSVGRGYDFKNVTRKQLEKNIVRSNQKKIVVDYESLEEY